MGWFVGWLLNVPATCKCISGADLLNFMCCHTETEVADQTFHLTQSQYTEPTSPSADPITPGAWQGSHWSANFLSHRYDSIPEKSQHKQDLNLGSSVLKGDGCLNHQANEAVSSQHSTQGGRLPTRSLRPSQDLR